jgi:hypothetical protein
MLRCLFSCGSARFISLRSRPDGHARWTLRLLARQMVKMAYVDSLSYETVRQTLKKTRSSRT